MNRQIVICDDNLEEAMRTRRLIQQFDVNDTFEGEITIYSNGKELVEACQKGKVAPRMIFIDIELDMNNDIELARQVNKVLPRCKIIYLSNYLKYATDAYKTNHFYFVVKSELEQRLPEISAKLIKTEQEETQTIAFELRKNQVAVVKVKDIYYFERDGRYTKIYTKNGVLETSAGISELEEKLDGEYFLRCHNSYIISLKYISNYTRELITVNEKVEIPVSRKYQKIAREQIMEWARTQTM